MTLKEKFGEYAKQEVWEKRNHNAEECEKIADEFAIGFTNWMNENSYKYSMQTTTEGLLEIYKKEKEL
jgi:hypothetical protein